MIEKKFKNELGNEIVLRVSRTEGKVTILIKGPKSDSEWIITPKEAEELSNCLHAESSN